jgi:hypothetical protein
MAATLANGLLVTLRFLLDDVAHFVDRKRTRQ